RGERADFASLTQVRQLAQRLRDSCPRIDVLVNNAGVWNKTRKTSAEGYEHTFAVNHLAPFLLTQLLLPCLHAAPHPRVVNVSSRLHRRERAFDLSDPHQRTRGYQGLRAYRQSKLANVMFTRQLARRMSGVLCTNAADPGDVATDVVRDSALLSWASRTIGRWRLLTPEEGARTSVFVASAPELAGLSGRYFAYCRQRAPSPVAYDRTQAEALWQLSESLTAS
ncbi:MAG TPA: SDR family NAD(P)-dependent oxidoreductase, partial [Sorangium sp.]|nr:SDR family NAD(P)-dependent oxidoreductase [Sorangium sp.]